MPNLYNGKIVKALAYEKAILEILKEDNHSLNEYVTEEEKGNGNLIRRHTYDATISKCINLQKFEMGTIIADRIVVEIKTGNVSLNYIKYFIQCAKNKFNAIIFIFTSFSNAQKKVLEESINKELKIVLICKEDLVKNPIMREVLGNYNKYLIKDNNILIKDNYLLLNKTNENLAFALGAGCSKQSNISDWTTLSKALGYELLYNIVDEKSSAYKRKIFTDELTDRIFQCYDKNSALDVIYNNFSNVYSQVDYWLAIKNVLYMSYDSPNDAKQALMDAIVACIKRKRIDTVISYNFDSVLEQNINPKYKSKDFEIENSITYMIGCTINHVHGYIPYDYDGKVDVNNFIFTDKEYYDNMINTASFTNIIQSRVFQNKNVIIIGVSFTDSNMKEILRKRKSLECKNNVFAFLKLPEFKFTGKDNKLIENKYKLIQECYFDSLGVKVLWVHDFNEIPNKINLI